MSVETNLYLGPYLKIETKYENVIVEKYGCPNETCERYYKKYNHLPRANKFCAVCGSELKTFTESERKILNPWYLLQDEREFCDELFETTSCGREIEKGYHILGSNRGDDGLPETNIESYYDRVYDYENRDALEEIKQFQRRYKKEIDFLTNKGFQYKMGWGLIIHKK